MLVDSQGVMECKALSFDKFHGKFNCRMEIRAHRQAVMPLHVLHNDYLVFGDPMHVCFLTSPTIVKPLGRSTLAELPVSSLFEFGTPHRAHFKPIRTTPYLL